MTLYTFKRTTRLLLSIISLVFFSNQSLASLADTIEKTKPSIVGIGTLQKTRRPPAQLLGTGFAVADGKHILTNSHVIPEELDEENKEVLVVFIGIGKEAITRPATLVKRDRAHDLGLLKINFRLPAMKPSDEKNIREGKRYAFTGFPIGMVLGLYPVTHRGIISSISPVAIPVNSAKSLDIAMIRRLKNPYNVYQLDATAYPGNSGSPLYDVETGDIVGVINKVFVKETKEKVLEKPSGITYAIPVKHVKSLLKEAGLKY